MSIRTETRGPLSSYGSAVPRYWISSGGPCTELLFAYGSLKRGLSNHAELRNAAFEGEVLTSARYRLVALGTYPALVAPGDRAVRGELYRVSADLLAELDAFEGEDYDRGSVTLADGRRAHAYFIAEWAMDRARPLDSNARCGSGLSCPLDLEPGHEVSQKLVG